MTSNLTTFKGSLGELIGTLREAHLTQNRRLAANIFPHTHQIKRLRGQVYETIRFFEKHLPELRDGVFQQLYPSSDEAEKCWIALDKLSRSLKRARQYFNISLRLEGDIDIRNDDINEAFRKLRESPAKRFENWITDGKSPDIRAVDDYIIRTESWLSLLGGTKKRGRPQDRFNILVFHVVREFTFRCFKWWWERKDGKYTLQRDYIMKDGKYRLRKDWQLICAALIWLHILEGIPEMKAWIKEHKDEETTTALKNLTAQIKKEYQNIRRSGKGSGKYAGAFGDGTEYLDINRVYADDSGSLHARLF